MTKTQRKTRTLLVVLLLATAGTLAFFFTAARTVEHLLGTERRFGAIAIRAYHPQVGPLLALRADSLEFTSASFRLLLAEPRVRLVDWLGMRPTDASLVLRADSIAFEALPGGSADSSAPSLPTTLRFPLKTLFEWRVLTVRLPGMPQLMTGRARWENRGSQAVHGVFNVIVPGDSARVSPEIETEVNARWRGPALRYRIEAHGEQELTLMLSGTREKRDLRAGFDSLFVFAARPERWFRTAGPFPLSDVRLAGKVDWRADSVRFHAAFATPARHPVHAASWNLNARAGGRGGQFHVRAAAGTTQTFDARGTWNHPRHWTAFPAWDTWRGELSGAVRGGFWDILHWSLPLDFEIVEARLDTGLAVRSRVLTAAKSRVDLRWSGRRPKRLELSGTVSPREPWALAWTHDHVGFESARVEAVWEDARLRATARVRTPRAYGAFADSLVAENEVTGSGYFLRGARVFEDGEVFTGGGQVLWRAPSGERAVSLGFEAEHATHGRAAIAMEFPGMLRLAADSLRPAHFPHQWALRHAAWAPRLHGTFAWNPAAGTGDIDVDAVLHGPGESGERVDARLDATWRQDSLRVRTVRADLGHARFEGEGVLPFDGRRLRGARDPRSLLGGAWRVRVDSLNPGRVVSLLRGEEPHPDSGGEGLHGRLAYSPDSGLAGDLRLDAIAFGGTEIDRIGLKGLGDSLRVDALVAYGARDAALDTVVAVFSDLKSGSPRVRASARSEDGRQARFDGVIAGWRELRGELRASGAGVALPPGLGRVEDVEMAGTLRAPLGREFLPELTLSSGRLSLRHVSPHDTIVVSGSPRYAAGSLLVPDLSAVPVRGDTLSGRLEARPLQRRASAELAGGNLDIVLPDGGIARAGTFAATFARDSGGGLSVAAEARDGYFALPPSGYRVETGFEYVNAAVSIPPARSAEPRKLVARGRLQDFLFQRKWGWRDATAYFTAFDRGGTSRAAAPGKRGRPWELDLSVEATGTSNRVDTDVLRMNFTGDARMTGVYPYTLINGKISGLQGEVGQVRQAFVLRDFEVKWDNVTMEDGTLFVEGEKKLRTDCRTETRQTCQIYVHLDGRLEEVALSYDTDCGQNTGEPVQPAVLINSMAQGCYVSEAAGGEGSYGSAAFAILEPAINQRLSREFARGSGGFIKSTQVSGLSALLGSDSSGLESVALEVESRSVHRVNLKGRAGYHPETKLANPMEYRLAAEYRPPLEKLARDSTWRERLQGRFTVEAAVETRPEGRDIEEERRVRQRAGIRYRHRFWGLW